MGTVKMCHAVYSMPFFREPFYLLKSLVLEMKAAAAISGDLIKLAIHSGSVVIDVIALP